MTATSGFHTDLNDAQWAIVAPLLPAAKPGSRLRTTCMRGVLDGVSYLLRTGCQWRLLSRCFPPWSTVHHYFRVWQHTGFWVRLHRAVFSQARLTAGRPACPSLVIMDGQSVRRRNVAARAGSTDTSWFGAQAAHFGHTLGLLIASRVEPANVPDQKAGPRLLAGLRILPSDPHGDGRCRSRKQQTHPAPTAARGLDADHHARWPACVQDQRSDLHRGTQLRLAWTQPPLQ